MHLRSLFKSSTASSSSLVDYYMGVYRCPKDPGPILTRPRILDRCRPSVTRLVLEPTGTIKEGGSTVRLGGLLVVLVLLLALPAASQAPDDRLIVPGERIGRWTLAVTMSEVEAVVRPPNLPPNQGSAIVDTRPGDDVREGVWTVFWPHVFFGIGINDPRNPRAIYLMVVSREYRTAKNVGPGVAADSVTQAYGAPTATTSVVAGVTRHIFNDVGIAFVVRGTEVIQVFVFRPGTAATIWKT